jgi:hypothetical protein
MEIGCEFAHPEIALNSGAGVAGINCIFLSADGLDITVRYNFL